MYLDTSVLVAYYCPEPLSLQVEELLRRQTSPIVSELAEVEFNSAIAMKVRQQELPQAQAFQVIAEFQKHLGSRLFTRLSLDSRHFQLAKTWLSQLQWPLRSLDALHLAIVDMTQTRLVTADQTMAKTATSLGIQALLMTPNTKSQQS